MPTIQSRRWSATLNNPESTECEQMELAFTQNHITYMILGKEMAPETGTPHLQIYLELKKKTSLGGLKKLLPTRMHLEASKGTQLQNLTYCKKDGDYREYGTPMKDGSLTCMELVAKAIRNQIPLNEIVSENLETFLRYPRGIERAIQIFGSIPRDFKTQVKVYYGSTGTGKSRRAHDENPLLWTHGGDRWFDGYANHDVALFDDFDGIKSGITYRKLLQLTDRYPLQAPVKGGFINWRPKVIVFTTNVMPENWYPGEDYAPLRRRIDELIDFNLFPYNKS